MSTKGKAKKLVRLIIISLVLVLSMIPTNTEVVWADTEVTIQPSAADAYVKAGVYVTYNFGACDKLYTNAGAPTNRFFMKFALSGIPSDATITSAKLQLYYPFECSAGDHTINVHRVQQDPARDWVEGTGSCSGSSTVGGVTWNEYDSGAWTTAGGDYAGTVSASAIVPATPYGVWIEWASTDQLVADVQDFLDNPSTNFGWVFKDSNEGTSGSRIFYSKEYATAAYRPKLVVTYIIVSAVAPTVTTQDADGITTTSATLHGNVTDTGGENPIRYFDWDTDSGEPYAHTEDCGTGGTGAYEREITGLTAGQTYYFRARAVNSGGTGTGSEKSFTTLSQATFQPSNADAYIQQASPTANRGSYDFLCVQSYTGSDNYRSVLSFDMSSLPGNATVTSATLSLYYQANGGNDPVGRTHYAYRVTQTAWTEGGITWNKYDGITNWATAGGDYTETDGVSATIPSGTGVWVNWTGDGMKNQVQYAVDNTGKVAHFLIRDGTENSGTLYLVGYPSKEHATAEKRPKLVVEYTAPEEPLTVDFSGTPLQGIKGSTLHSPTVQFSDATIGGTTPYTYDWDFGDGTTHGTTANPSHTYAPTGTLNGQKYTVSLTVTDAASGEDIETKADYITIYQKGDINTNLTVNSMDITKIERIVGGADAETFTSDVNDSGGVTSADVTATEVAVAEAWD